MIRTRTYTPQLLQQHIQEVIEKKIIFWGRKKYQQQCVIKGGMTSFDDGLKFSDHRALLIDLNESDLFPDKSKDPTARKNRGLSSKNKEQVKAYLDIVHAQFLAQNIYERCMNDGDGDISGGPRHYKRRLIT